MFHRSLLAFAAMLTLASPGLAAEIKAVASFSILGDMVRHVGGERVEVVTIVGANADTHVYEPRPADAIAVASADVFFVNGLGFEGWMDRFVEATGYTGLLVVASDGVTTHTMVDDGRTVTDPHAWQNLANAVAYVDTIARGLCEADAAGCDTYKANAATYEAEIRALDDAVKAGIAALPESKRKVITTHDAFGYFGAAYGVAFLAPEGVSTESEASAMDVGKLIDQIRSEGVTALFVENMSDPRLLEQIAGETGVKVGGELYSDALSEPGGGAPDYLSMFRHNIALLVPAMQGE